MMNIVVPMAGEGSRFREAGFHDPKPFISLGDKNMIQAVAQNLDAPGERKFIFICLVEHLKKYDLEKMMEGLRGPKVFFPLKKKTDGAARTVLEAKEHFQGSSPLVIANSDQFIPGGLDSFYLQAQKEQALILTMEAAGSKWSFVKRDAEGNIVEVQEKKPISEEATVGVYHFATGDMFIEAAQDMISAEDRTNGEFYVAPVYNYIVKKGVMPRPFHCGKAQRDVFGLGTPEDLEYFLKSDVNGQGRK